MNVLVCLGYVITAVLLPMLPAWLFFKLFPLNAATLNGRWYGLEFKLTGAFAGYFLIFATIFWATKSQMTQSPAEPWTVTGSIDPKSDIADINHIHTGTDQDAGTVEGNMENNAFKVRFRKAADDDFPNLTILCDTEPNAKYKTVSIPLDDKYPAPQYRPKKDGHVIRILEPVKIEKAPPESTPTGTPLQSLKQ
jgi:hypothetical protein